MEVSFVSNQIFHSFVSDENAKLHATNGDPRTIEFLANLGLSSSTALVNAITHLGGEKVQLVNGQNGQDIDAFITSKMGSIGFSGAVLVVQKGEILLQKGYGYSNLSKLIPNSSDTTFRIASLSKAFTSFALMRLIDQKKIAFTQNIAPFFPSYCILRPEWKNITIEMLMNHTSGICDLPDFISSFSAPILFSPHSTDHLLHIIARQKLLFKPGEFFYYSNPGYLLLSKIIQDVEGDSFSNTLQRLIFTPFGLKSTKAPEEELFDQSDAYGYFANDQLAPPNHVTVRIGAGNLISNISDLRLWMEEWKNPNHLHPDLLNKFFLPSPVEIHKKNPQKEFYSFGWKHRLVNGHHAMYHTGNMQGCHTLILFFPKEETFIIILSNKDLVKENLIELGKSIFQKISIA